VWRAAGPPTAADGFAASQGLLVVPIAPGSRLEEAIRLDVALQPAGIAVRVGISG
jgi:hypothetical protein